MATLSLLNFPAGKVRIQCTASDTHWPVRSGVGAISTYLDRGPRVTISSPVDGSAVARRDKVLVRYSVEEAGLSPTDDQASIAQTSLVVNGRTLNPVAEAGTTFSYELDLKDLSMFPETQGELKVEVRSTNRRSPTPATSTTLAQLKIDGDGPVIDVMSPYDATFVGQTTQVTARIRDDGTGIKQESVALPSRSTITPTAFRWKPATRPRTRWTSIVQYRLRSLPRARAAHGEHHRRGPRWQRDESF